VSPIPIHSPGAATAEYSLILALLVLAALSACALAGQPLRDVVSALYEQFGGDGGPPTPLPSPKEAPTEAKTDGAKPGGLGPSVPLPSLIIAGGTLACVAIIVWYLVSGWSNGVPTPPRQL
jgi:hypothetical protein